MRLVKKVDPEVLVRAIEEEVQLGGVGGVDEGELEMGEESHAVGAQRGNEASAEVGTSPSLK